MTPTQTKDWMRDNVVKILLSLITAMLGLMTTMILVYVGQHNETHLIQNQLNRELTIKVVEHGESCITLDSRINDMEDVDREQTIIINRHETDIQLLKAIQR